MFHREFAPSILSKLHYIKTVVTSAEQKFNCKFSDKTCKHCLKKCTRRKPHDHRSITCVFFIQRTKEEEMAQKNDDALSFDHVRKTLLKGSPLDPCTSLAPKLNAPVSKTLLKGSSMCNYR